MCDELNFYPIENSLLAFIRCKTTITILCSRSSSIVTTEHATGTMSSVDGDPTTLLDSTADYISTKLFGPMDEPCDDTASSNDVYDVEDADMADDQDTFQNNNDNEENEDVDDETTLSDSAKSPNGKGARNVTTSKKGSLHIIAATLAKIANVKSTKRTYEDTVTTNRPVEEVSDSMNHIVVDDGKELSIHSIRNASTSTASPLQDGEHTEHQPEEAINAEPTTEELDVDYVKDATTDAALVEENRTESLPLHMEDTQPVSSFADCICPFTSPFPENDPVSEKKEDEKGVGAPFDEEMEVANMEPIEALVTLTTNDSKEDTALVANGDVDDTPTELLSELPTVSFDADTDHAIKIVITEKDDTIATAECKNNATKFTKVESTAENSIVEETPSTRPFSFLSYVIPLSPIPSMNNNTDLERSMEHSAEQGDSIPDNELTVSILERKDEHVEDDDNDDDDVIGPDNDTSTIVSSGSTPINPPARWSLFSPFVTSYLDVNRNTDIFGKDPVGNQLTVRNGNADGDKDAEPFIATPSENGLLDPTGVGPILFTNSIDKSITPPWDRIDPPTLTASTTSTHPTDNTTNHLTTMTTDIETPASNDEILHTETLQSINDVSQSENASTLENESTRNIEGNEDSTELVDDIDDVECTMTGPVEKTVLTTNAPIPKSSPVLLPSTTSPNIKSVPTKYNRCKYIIVLFFLFVGALSAGIYFLTQNNSKSSSRVVAASQVDDSTNQNKNVSNSTTISTKPSSVPSTTRPTIPPTTSPVKRIVLPPAVTTNAPILLRPTATPSNLPSSSSDDDNDDANANGDDDADDDDVIAVVDDDGNTNDDDSVTDDNVSTSRNDDGTN